MATGHFTQLVWVASTSVGCAFIECNTRDTPGMYLMCEYNPTGNVDSNLTFSTALTLAQYVQNVLPI